MMTANNVASQVKSEELFLCESAQGLMNCKAFHILLEMFCIGIAKINPHIDEFLNLYFNDEGYVDIWRIPHLMIDIYNQNLNFHKVLKCGAFRTSFHHFLTELCVFCLSECHPSLNVKPDLSSSQNSLHNLRIRQQFLNTLMITFINVIENIENYGKAELKV